MFHVEHSAGRSTARIAIAAHVRLKGASVTLPGSARWPKKAARGDRGDSLEEPALTARGGAGGAGHGRLVRFDTGGPKVEMVGKVPDDAESGVQGAWAELV